MIGILTLPILGTLINEHTSKWDGYFYFLIFLLAFNSISAIFAVWAFYYDYKHRQLLHDPDHNKITDDLSEKEKLLPAEEAKVSVRALSRRSMIR
jgi:hypothetical protein